MFMVVLLKLVIYVNFIFYSKHCQALFVCRHRIERKKRARERENEKILALLYCHWKNSYRLRQRLRSFVHPLKAQLRSHCVQNTIRPDRRTRTQVSCL